MCQHMTYLEDISTMDYLMQSPAHALPPPGPAQFCAAHICTLSGWNEGSKDTINTWCTNSHFHRSTRLTCVSYECRTRPSLGTLCPQLTHRSALWTPLVDTWKHSLLLEDRHGQWQWREQPECVCLWGPQRRVLPSARQSERLQTFTRTSVHIRVWLPSLLCIPPMSSHCLPNRTSLSSPDRKDFFSNLKKTTKTNQSNNTSFKLD